MNSKPVELNCYLVTTPEVTLTWMGGPIKPDGAFVWLTRPGGEPMLRARREHVKPITREQFADLLFREARERKTARKAAGGN